MAAPYLKHTTLAVLPSAGDGEIANTQWNENHTLTLSANGLLGRSHATDANVAEISVGSTLTLSGNTLSVNVAGSNTYVLYHDNGALGANINFQFDPATATLKLGALSPVNINAVANLSVKTDLLFFDTTNDRIGIGTPAPEATLTVRSQGTNNKRGFLLSHSDNTTAFSQAKIVGARSRGSSGSPTAVLADDSLVSFNAVGYKATEWSNTVGGMYVYASENWTDTATGTYITFRGPANNTTTVTERMRIGHQSIIANGVLTVTANLVAQAQSSFTGAATFSDTITASAPTTAVTTLTVNANNSATYIADYVAARASNNFVRIHNSSNAGFAASGIRLQSNTTVTNIFQFNEHTNSGSFNISNDYSALRMDNTTSGNFDLFYPSNGGSLRMGPVGSIKVTLSNTTFSVTPNTSITGTLGVTGAATFSNTVTVNGSKFRVGDSTTADGWLDAKSFLGASATLLGPSARIELVNSWANGALSLYHQNSGASWLINYTDQELHLGAYSNVVLKLKTGLASEFMGKATFKAANTTISSINLPHGTAPTTPANGDVWTTTAGIYVHINGSTVGPLSTGGAAAGESFHPFLLMGA